MSRLFVDLSGKQFGKWSVLQRAENKYGFIFWACRCECGLVKNVCGASLTSGSSTQCKNCSLRGNKYGKGRPVGAHSAEETEALRQRNFERRGKPLTSEKALTAVRAACKKMNEVRHLQARHILSNVDAVALVADCNVCGKVPIKVIKHKQENLQHLRDQYLCWVGTRSREADGVSAQVAYPNQALEMWNAQESKCALCYSPMIREGNSQDGATLDHCHTTGKLRGFLHQGCNKGLGHFNDDLQKLKQAVAYLEQSA